MVDPTIMMALSNQASAQSTVTEETKKATKTLLDYCTTHPDATVRFSASDMALKIHSDASYLKAPKARSRVGGHLFLGNNPKPGSPDILNGAVLTATGILKNVVSSAVEAEMGGLYVNSREGEVLRTTLTELGWEQSGPTPVTTNNSTAGGSQRHDQTTKIEGHRHAILLGAQLRRPEALYHVIGAGSTQPC